MTKRIRLALTMAAALAAGLLAACSTTTPKALDTQPTTPLTQAELGTLPDAPIVGPEPSVRGVYIAIDRRTPLDDKALARARMTEDQVADFLKSAVQPSSTQPASATAPPVGDDRATEAPPQAVKYYLQGRQKYLEGANSEATTALEKALQLDPQAFTVLRLMGRVCFANSQLARGAMYLERAQALRPNDVEVNYLLGRYWIERNDFDKGSWFLMQAADSPERQITATFTPLSTFYLGLALQLGGYHLAAVDEYERFLELAELPVPGYRYDGELSYLINMKWGVQLAIAENLARLGDYHAALTHYRTAATARPDDTFIASRLINALVHDGQTAAARKAALDVVSTAKGGDDAVRLLGWTYQAAGRESDLIADLRAHLQDHAPAGPASEQTAAIILSITQDYLGHKLESLRTLADFLEQHPDNLEVLGHMLKNVDSAPAFALAMNATANAIAAKRDDSVSALRLFVPVSEGQAGAMYINAAVARQKNATDSLPLPAVAKGTPAYALYYLEARTRQAQNLPAPQVEAAFEASLKADAGFFPATQAYVSYLLVEEKFTKATAVIDSLMQSQPGSARATQLQIDSEVAQQRYLHALQIARDAGARFPDNADLHMQLVGIYRLRGQDDQADAELQAIIKDHPKYEIAYRSLVNALLSRPNTAAIRTTIVTALNQMAAEIPDSRFGRVASAVIFAQGGRFDDAQTLLRTVLARDPNDPEALVTLAKIQDIIGRTSDGVTLLESALRRKAQPDVVQSLASMFRDQDRKADALSLTKHYADANPDSESYALLYVAELIAQDKTEEAMARMIQLRARFPRSQNIAIQLARMQDRADDHVGAIATMRDFMAANGETTDRLYLLSHFYTTAGNEDACAAALQRLLTIMPDNIGANNDLGYFWVNAGLHLEQAGPMIRKALDNRPDDPAFLDSLAWLYYKQGRFEDARTLLQKVLTLPNGSAPEVIQHFADTLYRLGRVPEAIVQWEKALQLLTISEKLTPSDLKERAYLTQVVDDARAGRTPAVSPTVTEPPVLTEQTKAADRVATPTTPEN